MRKTLLFILICSVLCVHAERETNHTVRVRGEYAVITTSSAISGAQAIEYARDDARRKALESVFGTQMTIMDQIELSSKGESYNSLAISQTSGEIVDFVVIREGVESSSTRSKESIYYCEAKVTVKKGVPADPSFVADVSGIKSLYYDGEDLTFSITPLKDCYLNIFYFTNLSAGDLLYPSGYETPRLFQAGMTYQFPLPELGSIGYTVDKDTDAPYESNRLVFVFTKSEHRYMSVASNRADIERWIALIPNNEKYIYSIAFDIKSK